MGRRAMEKNSTKVPNLDTSITAFFKILDNSCYLIRFKCNLIFFKYFNLCNLMQIHANEMDLNKLNLFCLE